MDVKIFSQQECNYRQIQDTIGMLPKAVHEVDPQAKPDIVKALQAITMAVTGASKNLFFAVAEVNGVTAGFFGGSLMQFAFEDRTFGQDILLYVDPDYRNSLAAQKLAQNFADWCFVLGAEEVRCTLMNQKNNERLATAMQHMDYQEVGTIVVLKRKE